MNCSDSSNIDSQNSYKIFATDVRPIPNTLLIDLYEFPVASFQSATATFFSSGIAFLENVFYFPILSLAIFLIKSNVSTLNRNLFSGFHETIDQSD